MLIANLVSYTIIFIFVFERLIELSVNQFNKKIMISKYAAKIKFPKEALQMRIFHALWFVSLLTETYIAGTIANFFMLRRRIYLEEQSLDEEFYNSKFYKKNRFLLKII